MAKLNEHENSNTLTFILARACWDLYGKDVLSDLVVEFSIGKNVYISDNGAIGLNEQEIAKIKARMQEIIQLAMPRCFVM